MSTADPGTIFTPEGATFCRILSDQCLRYPRMELQDLYKLIFQAAWGSEHAASEVVAARRWLDRELKELAVGPEEPVIDPIAPDERIVRINLRPYMASEGDIEELLRAFVRTAQEYRGTEMTLRRYWDYAEQMATATWLPFSREALRGYFTTMQAQGLPAVHHSHSYRNAYHPAYRVVRYDFLAQTSGPVLTP
jgi:hypothetical protein